MEEVKHAQRDLFTHSYFRQKVDFFYFFFLIKKVMAVSDELLEAVCSHQSLKTLRIKSAGSLTEIDKRNYLKLLTTDMSLVL